LPVEAFRVSEEGRHAADGDAAPHSDLAQAFGIAVQSRRSARMPAVATDA